MKPSLHFPVISSLALSLAFSLLLGCGQDVAEQEAGPSYADLVTIHSTELAALDRLEKKREDLITRHEQQLRPAPEDTLQALGDALNSITTIESGPDPDAVFDPNAMLDEAVADAEKVQETAGKLLDSFSSERVVDEEETQRLEKLGEEFQRQLEAIDKKIEAQQARVDRAMAARDAAEAKAAGQ